MSASARHVINYSDLITRENVQLFMTSNFGSNHFPTIQKHREEL